MTDVYKKLADHLDKTPGGYPETESGVEIRILKQLFTPGEASLALHLVMMPETAEAIAKKADRDTDDIKPILIEMGRKGLIIHSHRNGQDMFMQAQFAIGIWEYQVNRLTKALIKDFNEYVPFLIKNQYRHKTQQMRIVPVQKAVNTELNIMDYEQLEHIINSQSKIRVVPCICRTEHSMMADGCDKPKENCLVFGSGAYMYERRDIGRTITKKEAMEIIQAGEANGLVPQPSNAKKPINVCLCCDCCCQILKNVKTLDEPAKIVSSNFQAAADEDICTGCRACEEICPMDAINMTADETIAVVNNTQCIGCGLCVTACEFDAMSLRQKAQIKRLEPPANVVETYLQIAKEKGMI